MALELGKRLPQGAELSLSLLSSSSSASHPQGWKEPQLPLKPRGLGRQPFSPSPGRKDQCPLACFSLVFLLGILITD